MKKLLILCLAGSMLALVGCKTKVHAPINYSDIFGEQKTIPGGIAVQVPSCTDTTDKFESNSVMEAKQKIPYIFPQAKYFKCVGEGFYSYAMFWVPLQVGGTDSQCKKDQICVVHGDGTGWIAVKMGDEVLKKSKELSKSDFDGNDIDIELSITNDTGKPIDIYVPASYIDNSDAYMANLTVNKDAKKMSVKLSNVATEYAIKGNTTPVFLDKEKDKAAKEKTNTK